MKEKVPGVPKDTGSPVDARLKAIAQHHRRELFQPYLGSLGEEPDLQAEMLQVVQSLQVFFNKWTVEVIVTLSLARSHRFNELKDALGGISGRTLSQRLKELEDQGLVARTLYDERPVRIEYSLTKKGMDVAYLSLPLVLYLRSAHKP